MSDNLPLGADNSSAPFNRKELSINVVTSVTIYNDYTIPIWEDEYEDMSPKELEEYVERAVKDYVQDKDEVVEHWYLV